LPLPVNTISAREILTVVAPSAGSTTAQFTAWERRSGRWTAVLGPMTARIGSQGIGAASETSTRTPAGTFTVTEAFGRSANPGSGLPYRVIDQQDWWVSDVTSPLYNQYKRCAAGTCPFNEAAGENLYAQGSVYDYAAVIDYNRGNIVRGSGSAYFLHVSNNAATAGCVAIDRTSLVSVLRWLKPAAMPLISLGVG
jgi:L,D-peptidoglycan transpeptidase YkuD (ErfK/YbiS/YcfS/YnhG family)